MLQFHIPEIATPQSDRRFDGTVHSYSMALLRAGIEFLLLDDIVDAGDITRIIPCLKRLIPTFVGLTSYKSKYAIECVNFLTKTEISLTEKESTRVLLQAFVNRRGGEGQNKPADMNQENNIQEVKRVVKGLGAVKSDQAMLRSSKAAPVISQLASNLNAQMGIKTKASRGHSSKSSEEDHACLHTYLRAEAPFGNKCRKMSINLRSSVLHDVDKLKLVTFMNRHKERAITPGMIGDDDEEEEEDDILYHLL